MQSYEYVIIGGGLAGQRAGDGIRKVDAEGTVALVTAEPHMPYERPPLSKGYLTGKKGEGTTVLEALLRIQAEQDRVADQRGPRLRRSLRRRHRIGRDPLPGDGRAEPGAGDRAGPHDRLRPGRRDQQGGPPHRPHRA